MRTLEFDSYGPPEVLKLKDVEKPEPRRGEVLIEIAATAVNPSDVKNVAGHFSSPVPRVPGRDYAGVVVAGQADSGVEVWGSGPGFGVVRDGAHTEYIVCPAEWVSEKPRSLSMEEAAAIGVPYLTAWSALVRTGAVEPGETVLIVGVSGAVGRAATQIAHWRGARVIGASRGTGSPSGADAVIDIDDRGARPRGPSIDRGKRRRPGVGHGGRPHVRAVATVAAIGGRQIAITSAKDRRVAFDLVDFYHNRVRAHRGGHDDTHWKRDRRDNERTAPRFRWRLSTSARGVDLASGTRGRGIRSRWPRW